MKTDKKGLRFVEELAMDVESRKKALRARMRAVRSELVNRDVKQNLLVENTLSLLEEICKSKGAGTRRSCFVYLSYSTEAATDTLIEKLISKGFAVYCPRLDGREMQAVLYGEDFTLSALGIREPTGEQYLGEINVAITPLLAADKQGNRLGYGGGFYDRFFKRHKETARVGYCFAAQVIRQVPVTDADEPLEYIVTEENCITIQKDKKIGE